MFRTLRRFAFALLVALGAAYLLAPLASADELPPPPANPNPANVVAWCAVGYAILGAILSALRPDNTALPFEVSASARAAIAGAGAVVEACLLGIVHGTPWAEAIGAAAVSALTAYATHGERTTPGASPAEAVAQKSRRPPPMPNGYVDRAVLYGVFLGAAVGFAACSLFSSPQAAATTIATIDGAACRLAALQPNEPAWEVYACTLLDPASGKVTRFTVRVPKEQSKAFAAAHAPPQMAAADGGAP